MVEGEEEEEEEVIIKRGVAAVEEVGVATTRMAPPSEIREPKISNETHTHTWTANCVGKERKFEFLLSYMTLCMFSH